MLQMKTSVSLGRDGHCSEIRKTLSQALLTVALILAAFLPRASSQGCVLACHGAQVSLDQDCQAVVTPQMVAYLDQCPNGQFTVYVIELDGDTIPTSPMVTEDERDETLIASVYDNISGQSCWSYITVEDKLPPMLSCNCPDVPPGDVSPECVVNCLEAVVYPGPDLIENCPGGAQIILLNETITPICHPDFIRKMTRQYTAVDASGNYADTCTEVLYLERIDFDQIDWPDSLSILNENELACDANFLDVNPADGIPDAAPLYLGGAGVPTIDGVPIYPDFINECNAQIFYEDLIIGPFTCVKKIMRMWRAFEWHCSGETEVIYIQLIELVDNEGPYMECPDDITVSTGILNCEATVYLPIPFTEDNCNDVIQISASYPFGFANNLLNTNGAYIQLPIGVHLITYTAYDECFNSTQCTWTITVQDWTAPVPICDEHTIVSLTNEYGHGLTLVQASAFDDGSYDECGPVTFTARRMTSCIDFDWTTYGAGEDEMPDGYVTDHDKGIVHFHSYVPFACCDVGEGPIMIELRVTDASGNYNSCMVEIEVQDKLPPVIQCPNNITVSCDFDFDVDDLSIFGTVRTDPDEREEICVYDPTNPNADGFGFVCIGLDGLAQDNCDVEVTEESFPALNNCGVGYIIRIFTATDPGGREAFCYQYIYVQNFDPFYINDQTCFNNDPNDGVIWPCDVDVFGCGADTDPEQTGAPIIFEDECDLVGVNYEDLVFEFVGGACLKILRTWRVIDWCQYGPNGYGGYYGYWEYKQVIKVLNTEAPEFLTDQDPISICNEVDCDDLFVELIQEATDDCTPDDELRASCTIDLFNDGLIDFTSEGFGSVIDASRFLPIGEHRFIFSFEDGCGSETVREQIVEVLACKPPTPVCLFLAADLMPVDTDNDGEIDWGMVIIWAVDFDASSYHACGYPVTLSFSPDTTDKSMEFTCNDLGLQTVQIWVTDQVIGEQDFCTTTIDIQDNLNACEDGPQLTGTISGQISTESTQNVKDVDVTLSGSGLVPVTTNGSGDYTFPTMPLGGSYQVMPGKNNDWKNGVSTLDLIQIQKHLLGMHQLESPYKMIAADANKSNSISAIDIVTLRRLILGIINEIPENTSWRFVDASYDFTDPANPLNEQFAESFEIAPFSTTMANVDFIGIKVGDVNNTVVANLNTVVTRTNPDALTLQVQEREFKQGEVFEVEFQAGEEIALEGYQFTLGFDATIMMYEEFASGAMEVTEDNFNTRNAASGVITTSWSDVNPFNMAEGKTLFTLRFRALSDGVLSKGMNVNSVATIAEAYNSQGEVLNIGLKFTDPLEASQIATEFELLENRPNPFSDLTVVSFITPRASQATITIYNVTGQIVDKRTVDAHAGRNDVEIRDLNARGVLYCQVSTDEFSATRKMIRIE
ncbi:MAG TPA: HYR domain-containing protein [Saprospiraceae bacterium]|nr:HYR domain-containing protein [Saprospiraceae bacterium]